MKLVVGLGNPGTEYKRSRHNAGFQALKTIAEKAGINRTSYNKIALQAEGRLCDEEIVLAQPCTYMNKSGRAVKKILYQYGEKPENLIILHDDLDLPLGRIKIKFSGGSAGHNGIKSISEHLETADFYRIRIGIGRPPEGIEVTQFVLGRFSREEYKIMRKVYENIFSALKIILQDGFQTAMNEYN